VRLHARQCGRPLSHYELVNIEYDVRVSRVDARDQRELETEFMKYKSFQRKDAGILA
jgi:hypothetical protein